MEDSSSVSMGLIVNQLKSDPLYAEFLNDDFDAKAVAAKTVENLAITDNLAKIAAGISLVDREIRHEVGSKYDELLSHATDIEDLEKNLQETFTSVKALKVVSDRLQSRMNECYNKVEQQTIMLGRLHETCELARNVTRLAGICRQLRQSNSKQSKDMIKNSQLFADMDSMLLNNGDSIHSVNAMRQHLTYLSEFRIDLIRQCQNLLKTSLEIQNPTQTSIALQSFHNMGMLEEQLGWLLNGYLEKATKSTKEALDANKLSQPEINLNAGRTPGRANIGGGGGAVFRGKLWTSIEALVASFATQISQIISLEAVMNKRKDTTSHETFMQIYTEKAKSDLVGSFWRDLSSMLSEELLSAASKYTFIRQALEGEYPKLIKIFTVKLERVDVSTLKLDVLENAYMSCSLSRLLDSVNICLANSPPTLEDFKAIVNVIISEIRVTEAVGDAKLLQKVAQNVSKTVKQLASRSGERIIKSAIPEASQVIGPATQTQRNNGVALHLLSQFSTMVSAFVNSLNCDAISSSVMLASLKHIDEAISSSLAPLMDSIGSAIEAIFLTMFEEKYDFEPKSKEVTCSLYMKEFTGFMRRVLSEYLPLLPDDGTVKGMIREQGGRAIELFLRFTTLIRPVANGGCLRLAADCEQLEAALEPLQPMFREDAFCRQFNCMRAFRPLLIMQEAQIAKAAVVGNVVPYSIVLHYLFARAPPELKSPHDAASWSLQRYSTWLDQHPSEKDRLVLIRGTLDSYLRWVKQNHVKEYHIIYVLIGDLLQRAVADCV